MPDRPRCVTCHSRVLWPSGQVYVVQAVCTGGRRGTCSRYRLAVTSFSAGAVSSTTLRARALIGLHRSQLVNPHRTQDKPVMMITACSWLLMLARSVWGKQ